MNTGPQEQPHSANRIRVMLVDDSPIIRGMNARILSHNSEIEIVASESNGELAVSRMDQGDIDVVVLDIEMPVMDGLTAIPLLLKKDRNVKILMSSTLTRRGAEVSFRAMDLGAADFIAKPTTGTVTEGGTTIEEYRREIVAKTLSLGAAALKKRSRLQHVPAAAVAAPAPAKPVLAVDATRGAPRIIAIGSSTGGPQALLKIFKELDKVIKCPIVITQHMPAHFTAILAKHIDNISPMPCREAVDGEFLESGHIYVAPGDYHMTVKADGVRHRISLNQNPPENFCRPAVDPMFRSIADCFGKRSLCVVLTGMGRDGASGAEVVSKAGGCVIAQDEETSVVWGMPGATYKTGVCSAILPISKIAGFINNAAKVSGHDS
ncbi:MAG: chemotaxis response regulator protein-glutamate methylesterase [Rhodospirillales bacterium]